MQEVAVIQGLQTQVVKLQIALGLERGAQTGQVKLLQPLVEQLVFHAFGDELRKVIRVAAGHFFLFDLFAQDLAADGVHQQARGDVGVVGVFFDQSPRGHDGRLVDLVDRNAVVQIAFGLGNDGLGLDVGAEAGAGFLDQAVQPFNVERDALAAVGDIQGGLSDSAWGGLAGPFLGALFAVEHIGTGDLVMAAAHQAKLDMVLYVLYVESAAARARAHQRADHRLGQLVDCLAHAGRSGALGAVYRQKGLHHGHGDLVGLEGHHGAVAANDLVAGVDRGLGAFDRRAQAGVAGAGEGGLGGGLHVSSDCFQFLWGALRDLGCLTVQGC